MQKIKGSFEVFCGAFWRENNLVQGVPKTWEFSDELDIVFVMN